MATQSTQEEGSLARDTVVRRSTPEQAQAVASAVTQNNTAEPLGNTSPFHDNDRVTSEIEDEVPPPAYGDIYGEIRSEKDGIGTSANVTDDGRVNIRVNQLNRRLSQVFSTTLHQQTQRVEDDLPRSTNVSSSLASAEGASLPPCLNVVIQVVGSRGDVQPFIALGKVLKETYGHRVRLATHPCFDSFVQENGLEFFSIGGDPSKLMAFMVKNPALMPGFRSLLSGDVARRRQDVAEYIEGCWRSCYESGNGLDADDLSGPTENESGLRSGTRPFVADCIIANPPSFAHIHCAEKLGIPLHIMFTMPYSPTQAFAHPLANIQSSNADRQLTNYISYALIELLSWQGLGDIINQFRAKCLSLDPVSVLWAPGMLQRLEVPHTYCWSPALIPKPKDWGPRISIAGFYFLNLASGYTPDVSLQAFLDAGAPPVYIGFGSIVLDDPNAMTELIFEAVKKTGQRVLLSKGWGGMGADELHVPDSVFMLGNVPHDWLFKQVSCVVHHGGAGTTAAGITAGRPTVVVPFFGDQPFWGAMVARAGAGPDSIPHKQLTADNLADAINFCLKPESLQRARTLADKITAERGSDKGAELFHQHLEADRLRCTIAPFRVAAWRVKRTSIRLSAFAAYTLANVGILDFDDVKLFRAQEYNTDEGPHDPVSGGFTTACRAASNMGVGIAELPTETFKALRVRPGVSRKRSEASGSSANEMNSSLINIPVSPPTSVGQSKTSLDVQDTVAGNLNQSTSKVSSNSKSDASQGQSTIREDGLNEMPKPSRNNTSSIKIGVSQRQSGAHANKGIGRFTKALIQSPMELSVSFTKGFHNAPKLWGDDTVRPQERVSDFKTGMNALGREFAFGWYDGVTGLVTQPWKGAQKDGASGFVKGMGKGLAGFIAKPGAAVVGILGHSMKGVHKELQKMYVGNVENHIAASRVAQGHEEWLQSSEAEKQDVVVRWKLIQKYLKKRKTDDIVRDVLEAQRKSKPENAEEGRNGGRKTSVAQSTNGTDEVTQANSTTEELQEENDMSAAIRLSVQETRRGDIQDDTEAERAIRESVSQSQHNRQEAIDYEVLRQTMNRSEADAERQASEALEFEKQLKLVIAQSLNEKRQTRNSSEWQAHAEYSNINTTTNGGSLPLYVGKHVQGITQSAFEAQHQGEKTTHEKTEEEVVMEYVKKQSLLEAHHHSKGKGRALASEDLDDEELQRALSLSLSLSMQRHEHDV
ncbi:hypothetical protein HBH56_063490 [Parastagonospora nodorum]|uniref:Glycosyltransferase family 28 N-terminal domain-containing protein n=1 Tax=Phaeosphaeria nodorum (strain SN15 / ATCC MYA-4574 / FGSC 10173) TaxID=321614 RepID=A0A7U2EWA0_PHANO|nr:hypothetical protein HBH56_063490 [Parastagonospora nodorum]QRC92149.1 hypothetical protein JI435_023060 [Parastagonospora nodorum SN15]KAH3930703.1 hypothetical protein HBH54_107430 [Parastagonospora nodorum]KAH3954220.1 hypothetical protein HBH53_022520 [Parastagonospora nodorum]KAH4000240.1 hypothetical protein HBI10_105210 [Parastagonospora nodorum]